MTVHRFPNCRVTRGSEATRLAASCMPISGSSLNSAGADIAPPGHAAPALFGGSPGHCLDDQGAGPVVSIHAPRYSSQQARMLNLFADKLVTDCILAEVASAELLSRCVHLRDSLLRVDPNNGESTCKRLRAPLLEKCAKNMGVGK